MPEHRTHSRPENTLRCSCAAPAAYRAFGVVGRRCKCNDKLTLTARGAQTSQSSWRCEIEKRCKHLCDVWIRIRSRPAEPDQPLGSAADVLRSGFGRAVAHVCPVLLEHVEVIAGGGIDATLKQHLGASQRVPLHARMPSCTFSSPWRHGREEDGHRKPTVADTRTRTPARTPHARTRMHAQTSLASVRMQLRLPLACTLGSLYVSTDPDTPPQVAHERERASTSEKEALSLSLPPPLSLTHSPSPPLSPGTLGHLSDVVQVFPA